jgi:hypothetical protein
MTNAGTQYPANRRLVTDSDNAQLDAILDHLVEAVQLTATQRADAEGKYNAVGGWLHAENSRMRVFDPQIFAQGSLRIDTTVKPLAREEFDLDLVCELAASDALTPGGAYELLWSRMSEHGTYRELIERCPRCIRINYAGDFHLDIVPAIPDPVDGGTALLIPDRDLQSWHPSNPKGYAVWFEDMARLPILEKKHTLGATIEPLRAPEPAATKAPLKLAVQLLKRWRDVAFGARQEAPPPSIVLTTIAGRVYGKERHVTDALSAILSGTLSCSYRSLSALTNPANPREFICERWLAAPGAYDAFCEELTQFAAAWQTLVQHGTFPAVGTDLMRLFGETPVRRALKAYAATFTKAREDGSLRAVSKTGTLVTGGATQGLRVPNHTFFGSTDDR